MLLVCVLDHATKGEKLEKVGVICSLHFTVCSAAISDRRKCMYITLLVACHIRKSAHCQTEREVVHFLQLFWLHPHAMRLRVSYFESAYLSAHSIKRRSNKLLRNNKKYKAVRVSYEIIDGSKHNNFRLVPTRWAQSVNR